MRLGDGRTIEADAIVLAQATEPTALPSLEIFPRDCSGRSVGCAGRAAIAKEVRLGKEDLGGGEVLAIGSACDDDVALSLTRGHRQTGRGVERGQRPGCTGPDERGALVRYSATGSLWR